MSIDNTSFKNQPQVGQNSKLNKFKKMFNYKIFGTSSSKAPKSPTDTEPPSKQGEEEITKDMKPPSLEPSASTKFFQSTKEADALIDLDSLPAKLATNTTNLIDTLVTYQLDDKVDTLDASFNSMHLLDQSRDQLAENSSKHNLLVDLSDTSMSETSNNVVETNATRDTSLVKNPSIGSLSSLSSGKAPNDFTSPVAAALVSISAPTSQTKQAYVPKLSQKQYVNRELKLNDVKKYVIKDSGTRFLFI
jgi:hypothetical protein